MVVAFSAANGSTDADVDEEEYKERGRPIHRRPFQYKEKLHHFRSCFIIHSLENEANKNIEKNWGGSFSTEDVGALTMIRGREKETARGSYYLLSQRVQVKQMHDHHCSFSSIFTSLFHCR